MKQTMQISALVIFTSLVVFPLSAMSEVKVTLKNGREVIADSCAEAGGKLTCYKSGGTFRIDRKDILAMKNITIEREPSLTVPEEGAVSPEKEAGKPAPALKEVEKQSGGGPIKGMKPEEKDKLDQINQKKIEYQVERQRLINERQQLHEDVKNTGLIKTQEQFDAIKKRITDLEARINSFNEDVRKLNEEGRQIMEGSTKQ